MARGGNETRCRNRQCSAKKGIHYNEAELLGQLQGFRWNQFFRDDRKGELLSQINQKALALQDELNKVNDQIAKTLAAQDEFIAQGRVWPERLDAAQQGTGKLRFAPVGAHRQKAESRRQEGSKSVQTA